MFLLTYNRYIILFNLQKQTNQKTKTKTKTKTNTNKIKT